MTENKHTDPGLSRKRQRRLKIVGTSILLSGLCVAGVIYWVGKQSTAQSEDELLRGNARAQSRQMEILYGKMGLLTQEISDDLKDPGTQAFLVAAVSIMVAAGCFYFARLEDDNEALRGESDTAK